MLRIRTYLNNRKFLISVLSLLTVFLVVECIGSYLGLRETPRSEAVTTGKNKKRRSSGELNAINASLKKRLRNFAPDRVYIVIDTGMNRLYLKKGDRVLHEAVVSSGSGNVLKDPSGKRQWVFDTPRGEFSVKSKKTSPVWTKPDWAFIEDGEAIPKNLSERIEPEVLGDFALGFGNGYFIHGTLYTRLLGRNVTHGCIRVGDKDLETVFRVSDLGTRIYIF